MQLFTVQENIEDTQQGFQPVEIQCILEGSMIQTVKPGDKVRCNGIIDLRNKQQKNHYKEYCLIENVEFLEREFEEITITPAEEKRILQFSEKPELFELLISQIAPSISGKHELKESLLMQLFSSDTIRNNDGTTQRGDIHILLIGDPGIGKSQILKYISTIAPRGVFTSGKSSSAAGLTASAVKDVDDVWALEAGAMVLADKGNVCIDEFDKMSEHDRSAIHEALEQQTISIAKAGMTTTLSSRCSVLAAANPKFGNFDEHKSLEEQLNLSSTLLSRFDLIFILRDTIDEENDIATAESILNSVTEKDNVIDTEFLKKYISYARREIHPVLTDETRDKLSKFYRKWRNFAKENMSLTPVTPRQLLAMLRLCKASARARLSQVVEEVDVDRAIRLQEYCINQGDFSISDATPQQVKEQEEKKLDDLCWKVVETQKEEYDNNIPGKTLLKELSNVTGKSYDYCRRWLITQDHNERMVLDTVSDHWSVR